MRLLREVGGDFALPLLPRLHPHLAVFARGSHLLLHHADVQPGYLTHGELVHQLLEGLFFHAAVEGVQRELEQLLLVRAADQERFGGAGAQRHGGHLLVLRILDVQFLVLREWILRVVSAFEEPHSSLRAARDEALGPGAQALDGFSAHRGPLDRHLELAGRVQQQDVACVRGHDQAGLAGVGVPQTGRLVGRKVRHLYFGVVSWRLIQVVVTLRELGQKLFA